MNLSRCVRRAFLCGVDDYSGKSYEHRRDWVESRLLELAAVFAIDLCAYALMSNHLHLILRVDLKTATEWTLEQVLQRWHLLYSGTLLSQRFLRGETLSDIEYLTLQQTTEVYRQRLMESVGLCVRSMNLLPDKPIGKTVAVVAFIRRHPWRSPCGPAKAVQIYSG